MSSMKDKEHMVEFTNYMALWKGIHCFAVEV